MNLTTLLEKMRSGRAISVEDHENMNYGIKITTIEAAERFQRSKSVKIKHGTGSSDYKRARSPELNCNRGEKSSVIPPLTEQVTAALFLNDNDLLVGGGVSSNQLFLVSMSEVRESNRMFKKLDNFYDLLNLFLQ